MCQCQTNPSLYFSVAVRETSPLMSAAFQATPQPSWHPAVDAKNRSQIHGQPYTYPAKNNTYAFFFKLVGSKQNVGNSECHTPTLWCPSSLAKSELTGLQ